MMSDTERLARVADCAKRGCGFCLRVKMPSGRHYVINKVGINLRIVATEGEGGLPFAGALLDLTLERADWLPALLNLTAATEVA